MKMLRLPRLVGVDFDKIDVFRSLQVTVKKARKTGFNSCPLSKSVLFQRPQNFYLLTFYFYFFGLIPLSSIVHTQVSDIRFEFCLLGNTN